MHGCCCGTQGSSFCGWCLLCWRWWTSSIHKLRLSMLSRRLSKKIFTPSVVWCSVVILCLLLRCLGPIRLSMGHGCISQVGEEKAGDRSTTCMNVKHSANDVSRGGGMSIWDDSSCRSRGSTPFCPSCRRWALDLESTTYTLRCCLLSACRSSC